MTEAKGTKTKWLLMAITVCTVVAIVFTGLSVLQYQLVKRGQWNPTQEHGLSGDMFGLANSIASAMAFALFIVTLRMQAIELKEQREQFTKMADAQTASDQKMQLQTYLNALTLESENSLPFANTGRFQDRLSEAANRLRFGRRARWVRQCIECDFERKPRPPSPDFEGMEASLRYLRYWRHLARYMDEAEAGEKNDERAKLIANSLVEVFDSEYWARLPDSPEKSLLSTLIEPSRIVSQLDGVNAFQRCWMTMNEAVKPLRPKFASITVQVFCPDTLRRD